MTQEENMKIVMTKEALLSLIQVTVNSDVPMEMKLSNIEQLIDKWYVEMDSLLEEMIQTWETKIPDSEQYLYTLGIRRVRDLLNGKSIEL